MTPADREEVERIAGAKAVGSSKGIGCGTVILALIYFYWLFVSGLSDRISALESQVRELKELKR